MKNMKVLGPGCKRCEAVAQMVSDYAEIAGFGIASTPGLAVDGKVVHADA